MKFVSYRNLFTIFASFLVGITITTGQIAAQENVQTATYKDWVVRCVDRENLPPCDAVQTAFNSDTNQQVMLTSIAHFGSSGEIGIQIWVPTGLLVSGGVLFEIDQEKRALENLQFTRCESDGCFIEAIVNEEALGPLKKGSQAAVAVLSSSGQPRIVGLSLSGFTKAFNEVKEKNTNWFEENS